MRRSKAYPTRGVAQKMLEGLLIAMLSVLLVIAGLWLLVALLLHEHVLKAMKRAYQRKMTTSEA